MFLTVRLLEATAAVAAVAGLAVWTTVIWPLPDHPTV